ncbi:MAG: hypothetical protein JO166_13370 [Deltaproteobacteria bacterium]|nr:hypothetical protein [Deltaproteobacteria bacterium]
MRIGNGLCCGAFRGARKIFKTVAAAGLIIALSFATSRAGDISAQPSNGLNVSNSVSNILPQAGGAPAGGAPGAVAGGGAGGPAAAGAPPVPGEENSWLSGLHISGYGNQTFGMWQNPTALKAYTHSRNNLAVARSLLQVDENYRLNENNNFFMREWFVYEPPYSFNSANNTDYGKASATHASFGHLMNGFYNNYQVRDAWWENKTGPLTTFVGNQIVVWGQSLAFRVGDVVNPADTCWAFGFANLEQSREPQWMLHPILNLPEFGQFTSNFVELVVQPGFQPRWWPEQTGDPLDKYRANLTAGRNVPCVPSASHGPSARFDLQYPTQEQFGFDAPLGPPPYSGGGAQSGTTLVTAPVSRQFLICDPGLIRPGFNPYAVFLKHFHPKCNTSLNRHQGNYSPNGDGTAADIGFWQVPGMQPQNWNEGVRFHTLFGATEWTALYYNDNTSGGGPSSLRWQVPYTNLWRFNDYDIQQAGVTMDRPLPMPASLAEYFPAVFRGEMLYSNHNLYNDMAFASMTGIRWSDVVKYMVAMDIDQAYAPWLTSTGNLTVNLETIQTIIMDNSKTCTFTAFNEPCVKNDVEALFSVGTSWWWSDFAPTWTMIYDPKGTTFALFPSIVLNPPWTKKYFLKLQAIEILGGDKGLPQTPGVFKGQSYLIAQFQYNFNLL